MRRSTLFALAFAASVVLPEEARAAGWSSFGAAFPSFPCPDGWMACVVDGASVGPDLTDGQSAGQRVSWFDLHATPSFSPFVELSAYVAPPPVASPSAPSPLRRSPPAPVRRPAAAPVPPAPQPVVEAPPAVEPPPVDMRCDACSRPPTGCDLPALEQPAMFGKLTSEQIHACEAALAAAPRMTDKKKVSVLLLNNAWTRGDKPGWEVLALRHLEEIDASDPDLAYKVALHLGRQGVGRAAGAVHFAEVALENRAAWTGDTHVSRVYSLYKVRALAAQALWRYAEEAHLVAPTEGTRRAADQRRNQTKVFAREWLDYARSVARDPAEARQVCTSAAGTVDACAD